MSFIKSGKLISPMLTVRNTIDATLPQDDDCEAASANCEVSVIASSYSSNYIKSMGTLKKIIGQILSFVKQHLKFNNLLFCVSSHLD